MTQKENTKVEQKEKKQEEKVSTKELTREQMKDIAQGFIEELDEMKPKISNKQKRTIGYYVKEEYKNRVHNKK